MFRGITRSPAFNPAFSPAFVTTGRIGETASGAYFSDDALLKRYFSNDAKTDRYFSLDLDTEPVVEKDINDILSGICAFWDLKQYIAATNGQTLPNFQRDNPADGSAKTDSDAWFGADNTSSSTDPTFVGNHVTLDGGDYFSSKGSNTPLIAAMHKTGTGALPWTFFAEIATGSTLIGTIFGTASADGETGIIIRIDSTGTFKVDQYDGTTHKTKAATTQLLVNTVNRVAASYDPVTDTLRLSVNSGTWQTFSPSGWTAGITGAATRNFKLCANGNAGSKMSSGYSFYGALLIDHVLTSAELGQAMSWAQDYWFPVSAIAPSQPTSVMGLGGDRSMNIGWILSSDGGALITDYDWEYRISPAGSWVAVVHAVSGYPAANITVPSNGVAYDVRVRAINNIGAGPWSDPATLTGTAYISDPFDTSYYKTTHPFDINGVRSGQCVETGQPALQSYNSWTLTHVGNTIRYLCPDGGAKTPNAKYAREELRHLTNILPEDCAITPIFDCLKYSVDYSTSGQKVVVDQIHTVPDEIFVLVHTYRPDATGILRVLTQPTLDAATTTTLLKSNIAPGDPTVVCIKYDNTNLYFWFDANVNPLTGRGIGLPDFTIPVTRDTATAGYLYWKRGNYNQSTALLGNYTIVTHYPQPGAYVP